MANFSNSQGTIEKNQYMHCSGVEELNAIVRDGQLRELIRINESQHERSFAQIADQICAQGAKVVMLAGPSSSGKTTSANRLATQLRMRGKEAILLSLDDYYIDRDKIPPGYGGKLDLEHISTLHTALFSQHMEALLQGQEVEIPSFNFKTGKQEWNARTIKLEEDSILLVEGLHGLNPVLLPKKVDISRVFRVYVCPRSSLKLSGNEQLDGSSLRLLRRIVRDHLSRGTSAQRTLAMWDSVRQGEDRWILPFRENADAEFDSATVYELAVLKRHILPLLPPVPPEDDWYGQVQNILWILDQVQEADVDDEIPPTSLVREFIGGNTYYG